MPSIRRLPKGSHGSRRWGFAGGSGLGPGRDREVAALERVDDEADLADILDAPIAPVEVLLDHAVEVGWKCAVEVVGDELDELLAGDFAWRRRQVRRRGREGPAT